MTTEQIATYALEDIVKQSHKVKAGTCEFIVLKEFYSSNWSTYASSVEILNDTRYSNEIAAFDAALADASRTASNNNACTVKNYKASSTKEICIAVVALDAHAHILCCYRVLRLP